MKILFKNTNFFRLLISLLILVLGVESNAQSSPFRVTGFLSIVGGGVVSGDFPENYLGPEKIYTFNCPCYIADWANAGVYTKQFSLAEESRLGVQASYNFSPEASVSAQLVSRGTQATPDLQWAYGSYKFGNQWEFQIGRKRIPLYYYSDFQDVGVSYPWVTPPPELYGWEATNYNGASLRYNKQLNDVNLTTSFFSGSETVKDAPYQKLYYPNSNRVNWNDLVGSDLEINYEYLTARVVYMQTSVRTRIFSEDIDNTADLKAYGIAVNLDFEKYFFVSELTQLTRNFSAPDYSYSAPALTFGGGIRIGRWTPFLNYAQYTEKSSDLNLYSPQSFKRTSFTLRYDLSSSSAIKAQFDRNTDVTRNFGGDTQVIRFSFDHVFE